MSASLPTFLKSYDQSAINSRVTPFVSLNDTMATVLYNTSVRLLANGGSCVYSCDGTTGPSSAGDHTNRWASKANCTTRGATAGAAQSFMVLSYAGVQILLAYQGASDDICRFAFSQGSNYTPAGTANQQPTATDETKWLETVTVVGSTTSADRVYSPICSTDGSIFFIPIFRQATLIELIGIEKIQEAAGVATGTVVAYNETNAYTGPSGSGGAYGTSSTAGAANGATARIASTNITCPKGTVDFNNSQGPFAAVPEINGGIVTFPTFWSSATASNTGVLGLRYDTYYAFSNTTALVNGYDLDDISQSERLVVLGACLRVWSSSNGVVQS